ncbi:MAG: acyltransferase [Spirochaetes bacterium]|nr:acyltransferase [Spirochaetota bacterium]
MTTQTDASWETKTGLSRVDFESMVKFTGLSDNPVDNRNRAIILGHSAEGILVAPGAVIKLADGYSIGPRCFIGLYTYISGMVTVASDVLIGPHCSITTNNHRFNPADMSFRGKNESAPITIGRGSWLAAGVMVTAGVTIALGTLICANAVVTRNTESLSIYAGTPAKKIGAIDPKTGDYHWSRS